MASFYSKAGALVRLSNSCRTASRNNPAQEFNNGVVLSAEPLKNNQLFEVKIDKKVHILNYFCLYFFKYANCRDADTAS